MLVVTEHVFCLQIIYGWTVVYGNRDEESMGVGSLS